MARPVPPLLIAYAVAHGVGACGIAGIVALLWLWLPGGRDSLLALVTVGSIGASAWAGVALAVRPPRLPPFANDNIPPAHIALEWAPIADPEATASVLSR